MRVTILKYIIVVNRVADALYDGYDLCYNIPTMKAVFNDPRGQIALIGPYSVCKYISYEC